jgi:glucosamine kinase
MTKDEAILLGVDGGGSGCRLALVAGGKRHEGAGGPANVSTDRAGAVAALDAALGRLFASAGLGRGDRGRVVAHLGLAGVVDDQTGQEVAEALGLGRATVTDDVPTAVAGALGGAEGAVAAIGTGSFVAGFFGGTLRRAGGWGYVLGDQASGGWLGRQAMARAVLAMDDLLPMTPLLSRMIETAGRTPARIVAFARDAGPSGFAALAPEVAAAAEAGDSEGVALMNEGAGYLRGALAAVGWRAGERLVFTGGLGPAYSRWSGLKSAVPVGSALDGALQLARKAAGEG